MSTDDLTAKQKLTALISQIADGLGEPGALHYAGTGGIEMQWTQPPEDVVETLKSLGATISMAMEVPQALRGDSREALLIAGVFPSSGSFTGKVGPSEAGRVLDLKFQAEGEAAGAMFTPDMRMAFALDVLGELTSDPDFMTRLVERAIESAGRDRGLEIIASLMQMSADMILPAEADPRSM
jgi:hypothetical protein